MRTLIAAGVIVALVVGTAGTVRAADDKPLETPYYPLKVGNKWTYQAGDGKMASDTKVTVQVTKFEDVESENKKQTCAVLELSGGTIKSPLVEKVAVKADGLYRYVAAGQDVKPPVLFLKLPPKKDEAWKIVDAKVGNEKLNGTFTSGEVDEVKVPAGTYKNVVTVTGTNFDANGQQLSMTYYFAKDVGMIKQTIKIGSTVVVLDLEKFEAVK